MAHGIAPFLGLFEDETLSKHAVNGGWRGYMHRERPERALNDAWFGLGRSGKCDISPRSCGIDSQPDMVSGLPFLMFPR
jgi:hypothetical protein